MPKTIPPRARRLPAAAMTVLFVLSLAACGGSSDDGAKGNAKKDDRVASLDTPSASGASGRAPSSAKEPGDGKGVQLRLDMTEDEKTRIDQAYTHCLRDQGVPSYTKTASQTGRKYVFPSKQADEYPDEYKACEGKRPIQPPELDPAKNPHYMDDFREWIRCDNDRGLAVEGLPDGGGWNYADKPGKVDPSSDESGRIDQECQRQAFRADD